MTYTHVAKSNYVCYIIGMKIGNLNIEGRVFCAPMAGISFSSYRGLARRFGAAVVYTGMVSSNGLVHNSKMSSKLLYFTEEERPIGIQLFGSDPEIMHRGAQIASQYHPDMIDLNFGCPVKKVVNRNGGAAVLKDLGLTKALIEAAVSASDLPVTVKLRSGWDEREKVYVAVGEMAEMAGTKAITLHARSRSRLFSGRACWDDIKRLKEAVSIPVIGNGDINDGADAMRMIEETGCDAVMIGRSAMGNPWIFSEANHFLATGQHLPEPTIKERIAVILEHAGRLIESEGEERAILQMRTQVAAYTKGWSGGGELRRQMMAVRKRAELEILLREYSQRRLDDRETVSDRSV